MWFTMRSMRSGVLVGRRTPMRESGPAAMAARRVAKCSRTAQSAGCTVSSTRSKTAKPTGLVSMPRSALRALAMVPRASSTKSASVPAPAARRRNTSRSYQLV